MRYIFLLVILLFVFSGCTKQDTIIKECNKLPWDNCDRQQCIAEGLIGYIGHEEASVNYWQCMFLDAQAKLVVCEMRK
jgi:hypothetical protein